MTIRYIKGDATRPDVPGLKVIAHIVNDMGAWGAGFISARWTEPERKYREWGEGRTLGRVQTVQVEPDIWVANMCAQRGFTVQLESLEWCLKKLNPMVASRNATVHMPRIGGIEPIIQRCLQVPVFVYDYAR